MKRPKIKCEIQNCDVTDPALLHRHHIVERTEIGTSNDDFNLAILCANHHAMTHGTKRLKIIGVFPSTQPPSGKTLIYCLDGVVNVPEVAEAYFNYKAPSMKITDKEKE